MAQALICLVFDDACCSGSPLSRQLRHRFSTQPSTSLSTSPLGATCRPPHARARTLASTAASTIAATITTSVSTDLPVAADDDAARCGRAA
jgi:hypothetical protein